MNNEEMIKLHFQKVYEIVLEGLNEPLKNFVKNMNETEYNKFIKNISYT